MHPPRHLDLEGSHNVRDLGGYDTGDGRRTKWRRLLRADGLHQLTGAAQAKLLGMGLRTVLDLRRGSELAAAPSVFADSPSVAYHHLDMIGEGPIDASQPLGEGADRIAAIYCSWLDQRQEAIGAILTTLAAPGAVPALFNCAAGKDRTGVTAALLLGLAGVPEEVIAADYALSARLLAARYAVDLQALGWQDYLAQFAPPAAMERVLGHLRDEYGGVEPYVRVLGLTADEVRRLRAGLLE